jgi:hypothetical protein
MKATTEDIVRLMGAMLLGGILVAAMGALPSRAGAPSSPALQIELSASTSTIRMGDCAVLKVQMANAAKEPLSLQMPLTTKLGNLDNQFLRIVVRTAAGEEAPLPISDIDGPSGASRQQVLPPDGKFVLEYDFFALLGGAIVPGKYSIEARYEDKKAGIKASSNALAITVDRGTSDDVKALELYQGVLRAGERVLAIDLARRLLKEYPKTAVADRAKEALAENLFFAGRKSEAEVLWRELLAARPTWRDQVRMHLAMYLQDQGKIKEAIQVLEPVQTEYAQGLVKGWKQMISAAVPDATPTNTSGTPAGRVSP